MKILFIFLISITVISSNSYAMGPLYRDFLVKEQAMPHTLLWEQDFASQTVDFSSIENTSDKSSIRHKQTLFDLFPVLTTNNSTSFTSLGGGYMRDDFNTTKGELANYYSGAYLSFYGISRISKKWYTVGYISYGNFSNKHVMTSSKTDKILSFVNFGYKHNASLIYKFGAMYNSNFGNGILLPTLGLSYSWNSLVIDVMLPSHTNLRYVFTKKLHTVVSAETQFSSYYDNEREDVLEITGIDLGARVEYNFYQFFWFHIGFNYAGEKELQWSNNETKLGSIDASFKLNGGLIARF